MNKYQLIIYLISLLISVINTCGIIIYKNKIYIDYKRTVKVKFRMLDIIIYLLSLLIPFYNIFVSLGTLLYMNDEYYKYEDSKKLTNKIIKLLNKKF